jgi:hypothetical protein
MADRRIAVFFYGSYMNLDVLAEVELRPERVAPAQLTGYEITIAPRANLQPRPGATAFGIVAYATHPELARLYTHSRRVLGAEYLPEGVLVQLLGGGFQAASCYISHSMQAAPATADYVERIVAPARSHGFPAWYLERLSSFNPD